MSAPPEPPKDHHRPPRPPARPTIHPPLPPSPTQNEPPTLWTALTTLRLSDFTKVHTIPCAREALLAGISAGFAFGGVKLILRATVPTAANWAVGTFCGTAVVVYEACGLRRFKERAGMQRAVEIMERQKREARGRPGGGGGLGIQRKENRGSIASHQSVVGDMVEGGEGREKGKGKGKGEVAGVVVVETVPVVEGKGEGGRSWYKFW